MAYEFLLTEVRDRVLHITLNRPEKLNALSEPLLEEFFDTLLVADQSSDVGSIVVKGSGRAFSSGYDIQPNPQRTTSYDSGIRDDIARMEKRHRRWRTLWELSKPSVAQVHGYCIAGGTDLAQHCDMIVASEDAQFGFPPVRSMGSPPTHMWTYNVGPQWAKYMLLTGNSIDGKTAVSIGLAMKAVPAGDLGDEAHDIARRMAMIDPALLAANKSICNKAIELMGRTLLQQLALEMDAVGHKAPAVQEFNQIAREQGLKAALSWRDGKFAK